jgi:hypothetical protein
MVQVDLRTSSVQGLLTIAPESTMAELKTKKTGANVSAYLNVIADRQILPLHQAAGGYRSGSAAGINRQLSQRNASHVSIERGER